MEEKEASRRFPYFRPAGTVRFGAFARPGTRFSLVPFARERTSSPTFDNPASPSLPRATCDPSFLPSTGNLSPVKNNTVRANGIVAVHAGMIGAPEHLVCVPGIGGLSLKIAMGVEERNAAARAKLGTRPFVFSHRPRRKYGNLSPASPVTYGIRSNLFVSNMDI